MIETPNLRLIPCESKHFEAALDDSGRLARMLGVSAAEGWLVFGEAMRFGYERLRADPDLLGWWTHLFVHLADERLIGTGGFAGAPDESGRVEIGYALAPAYRGRGLATEAARGLVGYAFAQPQVRAVEARTLAAENASTRVLEKAGLRRIGTAHDHDEGEVWRWRLTREEYKPGGELQSSYDRVAEHYAARFRDELDAKPFDCKMLDLLIEKTGGAGAICDMGCGPGQVARYLHSRGAKACGVDLSLEMVRRAQELNPDVPFCRGDMLALADVADGSYGGIAAFYSVVHIPRPQVVRALRELRRALRSGGALLLAFHIGREVKHLDEWWGERVSVDFLFFEIEEMKEYLTAAGFDVQEVIEREPYPEDVEYQSRRAYIFARKA